MSIVLVVEDNLVVAGLVERLLELAAPDVQVRVVSTSPRTLLDPKTPDWDGVSVAVIDLMLPGVDGVQLLGVAKLFHPQIHRIAYTAAEGPLVDEARQLADVVVIKGSTEQLIERIGAALEVRR